MKRSLLTLLGVALMSATALAQQGAYVFDYATAAPTSANLSGTDTVYGTVPSSLPAIPVAQYHLWDLSTVILGSYKYYSTFQAETGVGSATHSNLAYIEAAPGMKYQTKLMFAVEQSGIKTYGERLERQAFSLLASTGNPNDSIVLLKQDVVYSTPQVQIPYPCSIGTKWNTNSKSIVNFKMSINSPPSPIPPLIDVPGERRSTTTTTNEVVGWGLMKIRRLDGKPSGVRAVLQVETTISIVDSIYLNGSPAPAQLLTMAGLTQGQTTNVYQRSFYRENEVLPMANVTYTAASFTTVKDVNFTEARLPWPDDVAEVSAAGNVEVYPNPVTGNSFTVKLGDQGNAKLSYVITDATGKKVLEDVLNTTTGNGTTVHLPQSVTPGIYMLNIKQGNEFVAGRKLVVQ